MLFDIQKFYNVQIEELPANVADLIWFGLPIIGMLFIMEAAVIILFIMAQGNEGISLARL